MITLFIFLGAVALGRGREVTVILDSHHAIWPNWPWSFVNLSGGGGCKGKREAKKKKEEEEKIRTILAELWVMELTHFGTAL